jgi:hypothetical protein
VTLCVVLRDFVSSDGRGRKEEVLLAATAHGLVPYLAPQVPDALFASRALVVVRLFVFFGVAPSKKQDDTTDKKTEHDNHYPCRRAHIVTAIRAF